MNIADILIVYLTLGAPFAVYKYLQRATDPREQKVLRSLATLLFWMPDAIRLGTRYLTNAYSAYDFVSTDDLDAQSGRIAEIRTDLTNELCQGATSQARREIREVVERYTALAAALDGSVEPQAAVYLDFLEVAGHRQKQTGVATLVRQNRRKLRNHLIRARRDLMGYLESQPPSPGRPHKAVALTVELSTLLNDEDALVWLESQSAQERGRIWNTQSPTLEEAAAQRSRLATSSLTGE